MVKIVVNKERAVEVSRAAISMLERKVFPFNQPDIFPDAIVPEWIEKGSVEHAFLITYGYLTDSMRKAVKVYRAIRDISKERKLSTLCYLSEREIEKLIERHLEKGNGKGTIGEPAKAIHYNSMRIEHDYGNNPVNIKQETMEKTLEELTGRKGKAKNFFHVGEGKAALIMKNFVRFGFWDFSPYEIPIKVDRHIIRISLGAGVIEVPDSENIRANTLAKYLTQVYREVTSEERISAVDLNDALWAIGSYLCLRNRHEHCSLNCDIRCTRRPYSDPNASLYQINTDKRKGDKSQQVLQF